MALNDHQRERIGSYFSRNYVEGEGVEKATLTSKPKSTVREAGMSQQKIRRSKPIAFRTIFRPEEEVLRRGSNKGKRKKEAGGGTGSKPGTRKIIFPSVH